MPDSSPQGIIDALLREQIQTLANDLNRRFDASERDTRERFNQQDRQLQRIEAKVDKTNGRVSTLEKARERAQGVMTAFRWVPVVLSALLTAGVTILVMALSGGVH